MDELAGEVLMICMDNGSVFRNSYSTDGRYVTWEAVSGPAEGRRERCPLHWVRLTPGVFFLNWIESDATTVSHVLNLTTMTAEVFWSFGAKRSRAGRLHTAKLRFA